MVPELVARGVDNIVFQTVIRADNLDSAPDVIAWASVHRVKVSLSAYTPGKNGNESYTVRADFSGVSAGAARLLSPVTDTLRAT